jgi:hypothetical protein
MRKTLAWVLGLAVAASAIGCDKGSGGGGETVDPKSPVGTWALDTKPMAEAMKPMVEGMKKMAEMMPDGPDKTKALKDAEEKFAAFGKMKAEITLKKDGTAAFEMDMPGEDHESGTGTWKQAGESVTITQTTKNGKPAEGKSAEPKVCQFKDGKLSATEGGMTMNFNRK